MFPWRHQQFGVFTLMYLLKFNMERCAHTEFLRKALLPLIQNSESKASIQAGFLLNSQMIPEYNMSINPSVILSLCKTESKLQALTQVRLSGFLPPTPQSTAIFVTFWTGHSPAPLYLCTSRPSHIESLSQHCHLATPQHNLTHTQWWARLSLILLSRKEGVLSLFLPMASMCYTAKAPSVMSQLYNYLRTCTSLQIMQSLQGPFIRSL